MFEGGARRLRGSMSQLWELVARILLSQILERRRDGYTKRCDKGLGIQRGNLHNLINAPHIKINYVKMLK